MAGELNDVKIKMKALGLTRRQIESIIDQSLYGKEWIELNEDEKDDVIRSLNERIAFTRKLLQMLNCNSCCK